MQAEVMRGSRREPLLVKKNVYYENCPGCKVDRTKQLNQVIGIIVVVVFNTLFGLSTSFWMAIITRFLLGSLNGSLGTIKAYATEIFREEHQAKGLATFSSAWGIALVIGPALGGYLALPAEKYPHLFPKGSFLDKFPYFLPCFLISAFALAVLVSCIWLPETLHKHNFRKMKTSS
ncbi:hypothetical protein K1719_042185 [Acacia pycnantha]|nr:hypothetical protein K1719_042185 [Acacia pycnantha]